MQSLIKAFSSFLFKFGILDQEGVNDFNKDYFIPKRNEQSPDCQKSEASSERKIIAGLSKYLKSQYRDSKTNSLSNNIYDRFITYDDELILKTIRKVLIIYAHRIRNMKLQDFLKWKLCARKIALGKYNLCRELNTHRQTTAPHENNLVVYKKKVKGNFVSKKNEELKKNSKSERQNTIQLHENKMEKAEKKEKIPKKKVLKAQKAKSHSPNSIIKTENCSFLQNSRTHFINTCRHFKNEDKAIAESFKNSQIRNSNSTRNHNRSRSKECKDRCFLKLYNDGKNKEKRIVQMSLEKEMNFNEVYTFEPSLYHSNSTKRQNGVPSGNFIERLKTYQDYKNIKLHKIQKEVHDSIPKPRKMVRSQSCNLLKELKKIKQIECSMLQEQGCTFKPVLNTSINAAIPSNIIERNDEFLKTKLAKNQLLSSRDLDECTFAPKINISAISPSSEKKVGDRLFQYQSKYKQSLEEKKQSYVESYPFKPEISKNTYELLKKRDEAIEEIKKKYKDCQDKEYLLKKKILKEEKEKINEKDFDKPIEKTQPLTEAIRWSPHHKNIITASPVQQIAELKTNIPSSLHKTDTPNNREQLKQQKINSTQNNKVYLQNISDSKILELANQYITTDESLEKFQRRMREKFTSPLNREKENYLLGINRSLKDKISTEKKFESLVNFPEVEAKKESARTKNQKVTKPIFKNSISSDMEYYENLI